MAGKAISVRNQRIEAEDLPQIAEQLCQEYDQRKKNRKDIESDWDEVDRQLEMRPETSHKKKADGKTMDPNCAWMPETELPQQSQTLEQLATDAKRLQFPRGREWFRLRAALTESYLAKFGEVESPIAGERGRFDGTINQDNADRLATAAMSHYHRQYPFNDYVNSINCESFSYGFGVGRFVPVKKKILGHQMRGDPKESTVPMLLPRSARDVYLDDTSQAVLHEGFDIGPNTILYRKLRLADLRAAAASDDNYIKSQIDRLSADKNGEIELVELEGTLVYDASSTETVVAKNVVILAARGTDKQRSTFAIVHYKEGSGNSYLVFDYHKENVKRRYGSSPLLKGAGVNRVMAQIANRLIESGQLKIKPPLGYSRDDVAFAATGGPVVYPGATWETTEDVKVYKEIGGDPAVFGGLFVQWLNMYYDVSSVNPTRLGDKTKSHTTAFSKDVEITQGVSRTVDYVDSTLEGPLPQFLEMEYRYALKNWKKDTIFVKPWDEFVEISKSHLPDTVYVEAFGAGQPAEEAARTQSKLAAVQFALQLDQISIQLGNEPKLDLGKLIEKTLQEAGFQDVSEVTTDDAAEQQAAPAANGQGQLVGALSSELQ